MARKKTRTRRRKSFKLLNALESLTYAEILSRGIAGTGIVGLITGQGDIAESYDSTGMMTGYTGTGSISLSDIVSNPGVATSTMATNLQNNIIPMAVGAATTAATFNIGRRLLRRPINNINRTLMAPLLGSGIKL
jgi:hypothetical protein